MYGYAGADPINSSDPFGLCPDACVLEGGAGVAALATGLFIAGSALVAGDDLGDALDQGWQGAKSLVGNIFAAVSGKILEKRLTGQESNIATHFQKLSSSGGPGGNDPRWRDKWKRDIEKGIREMRKLADRLKGKDLDRWQDRIRDIEDQLRGMD